LQNSTGFELKKLNIHDFTIELEKSLHRALREGKGRGGIWNAKWAEFIEKTQQPAKKKFGNSPMN
jgi:hypothetical protein